MESDTCDPPSPGRIDIIPTQMTTSGTELANSLKSDSIEQNSQGHQGEISTGGNNVNLRVLWCTHMSLSTNYEELYNVFKVSGEIDRIKLKLTNDEKHFEAFITFHDFKAAHLAQGLSLYKTKVISTKNLKEEDSDFIPTLYMKTESIEQIERQKPSPVWFIASYKEGRDNIVAGTKCLKRKFGHIPMGNIKKYGKGILLKADNKIQAAMMNNFVPSREDIISKVVPHHSFNITKGVVYSRDLFEFSIEEILEMCPSTVYEVKKLSGSNGAILLHFNSRFLPDYINIEHLRIRVKKYKHRPKQCFQCFDFGHVVTSCRNSPRCPSCSGLHGKSEPCGPIVCLNCGGNHLPSSRTCARFRFEQEVLDVAHNEFVSIGNAKQIVMGANQSPDSSYASVLKEIRNKFNNTRSRSKYLSKPSSTPTADTPSDIVNTEVPSPSKPHLMENQSQKTDKQTSLKPNATTGGQPNSHKGNSHKGTSNKGTKKLESKSSVLAGAHALQTKPKEQKTPQTKNSMEDHTSSIESIMDANVSNSQKAQREHSDSEEFNIPNKRHRSHKSPQNSFDAISTSNSYAPLNISEKEHDVTLDPVSDRKVGISINPNMPSRTVTTECTGAKSKIPLPRNNSKSGSRKKLSTDNFSSNSRENVSQPGNGRSGNKS